VGDTEAEVTALIRDAVKFHIEGMPLNGEPIPVPTSRVEYVEVAELHWATERAYLRSE
jgi:predicted RNase H-like HicB family nuclease